MEQNPFTFGSMITDPNRFIGRRAELTTIIDRLNGVQAQGSAVVGPRRIGKSSLLHYLYRPRDDERLQPPPAVPVIYLSAAAGDCQTPDQFRTTLILKIIARYALDRRTTMGRELHKIQQQVASNRSCSWATAREALERLPDAPIVCLDEFEALLMDPFADRFFTALRNWANEGLLNWVTASAKPLQELSKLHGLNSPFFNVLATVRLDELTEAEAAELLALAERSAHPFSDREKKKLRQIAASNHPYHLQIVAWHLWRMKAAGSVNFNLLREELCQQPNPPLHCQKRPRPHVAWMVALALLVVVVVLLAMLVWQAPDFMLGMWTVIRNWMGRIFTGVGSVGDIASGVIVLAAIAAAIWAVVRYRKPLGQTLRELWERLEG